LAHATNPACTGRSLHQETRHERARSAQRAWAAAARGGRGTGRLGSGHGCVRGKHSSGTRHEAPELCACPCSPCRARNSAAFVWDHRSAVHALVRILRQRNDGALPATTALSASCSCERPVGGSPAQRTIAPASPDPVSADTTSRERVRAAALPGQRSCGGRSLHCLCFVGVLVWVMPAPRFWSAR